MKHIKPGQAVAQVIIPAGWVISSAEIVRTYGAERLEALIAELQQDTNSARIRGLMAGIAQRHPAEQKMIAIAMALGANLVLLLQEWLDAPDDPQEARRTPRSTGNN